ncbi:hypothetical protein XM52_07750 [Roseovarius indicus]|uniref:Uncharacterized protein n=1 Tax=Roseovarius indicus TaxID=540747 RepID=A0A0T5PC28_9RHOB|nr:hypothetical protein XM52_07750 [Roseovarius indicus]
MTQIHKHLVINASKVFALIYTLPNSPHERSRHAAHTPTKRLSRHRSDWQRNGCIFPVGDVATRSQSDPQGPRNGPGFQTVRTRRAWPATDRSWRDVLYRKREEPVRHAGA